MKYVKVYWTPCIWNLFNTTNFCTAILNDLPFLLGPDFSCLQQTNSNSLDTSETNTAASIRSFTKLIRLAICLLSLPGHGCVMQSVFSLKKMRIIEELYLDEYICSAYSNMKLVLINSMWAVLFWNKAIFFLKLNSFCLVTKQWC